MNMNAGPKTETQPMWHGVPCKDGADSWTDKHERARRKDKEKVEKW